MSSETTVIKKDEVGDLVAGAKIVSINHYTDDEKSSLVLGIDKGEDSFLLVLKATNQNEVVEITKGKWRHVGGNQIFAQLYGDVIRSETGDEDNKLVFSFEKNDDLTVELDGHKFLISGADDGPSAFHAMAAHRLEQAGVLRDQIADRAGQYLDTGLQRMGRHPILTAAVPLVAGILLGVLIGATLGDFAKKQKKWW